MLISLAAAAEIGVDDGVAAAFLSELDDDYLIKRRTLLRAFHGEQHVFSRLTLAGVLVKQCSVSWLATGWQCTARVAPRNNSKLLKLDQELLDVIEGSSNHLQSFSSSFQNVLLS